MNDIRVRFAPSPTGFLHIGGVRTALFNYLYARRLGGKFLLRIEDTDKTRSSDAMIKIIRDSLAWLGMEIDEEIVLQSRNESRHRQAALELYRNHHAYYCRCSNETMEQLRQNASKQGVPVTSLHSCRELTLDYQPGYALRFKIPTDRRIEFNDIVHGMISVHSREIEDFVLLRGDESPTYQIAVVSDDIDMQISHIIRGDDHISNTPKQILIYQGLNQNIPQFGHLPLIMAPDGKKLSKRDGMVAPHEYYKTGILPQAMLNFITLLGWSNGSNQEYFTLEDLIHQFDLNGISKKNSIFDPQRLQHINGLHLKQMTPQILAGVLLDYHSSYPRWTLLENNAYFLQVIELMQGRLHTLNDFFEYSAFFFDDKVTYDKAALDKYWSDPVSVMDFLAAIRNQLEALPSFENQDIETMLRKLAESRHLKAAALIHPLRVALTGCSVSAGIFEVAALLGKKRCLARLEAALSFLEHPLNKE